MSLDGLKQDRRSPTRTPDTVLITGGAGFIGTNLANRLLTENRSVRIFDNLSRAGVERNLDWLVRNHDPGLLEIRIGDIRDAAAVEKAVDGAGKVFHLAAQVAVTTSIENPLEDFDINVRGTLNLLEAMRRRPRPPAMIYTSTNKVYGNLDNISLQRNGTRYQPSDPGILEHGVSELQFLQFWSPYGCSKGTADQYILDYARVYGLRTVVLRMSCIYGPHQFGTEDQGWVAHFLIRGSTGAPITIFGDGMQVRDILYVDDLVEALLTAGQNAEQLRGRAFNIGGGPQNTLSLIELLKLIEELEGKPPRVVYAGWRSGDQRYFVADTRLFTSLTRWSTRVAVRAGVTALHRWFKSDHTSMMPMAPKAQAIDRLST